MKPYQLTETAERELDRMLDYIVAHQSYERAVHVYAMLEEALTLLGGSPNIGVLRPAITADHLRWWGTAGYWIVYRCEDRPVTVMRFIHQSRNIADAWAEGPDEP